MRFSTLAALALPFAVVSKWNLILRSAAGMDVQYRTGNTDAIDIVGPNENAYWWVPHSLPHASKKDGLTLTL